MTTAIDTNVLLDIQVQDPVHFAHSAQALEHAADQGALINGEVVYAELGARLRGADLNRFLDDLGIDYVPSPQDALARAGIAFRDYLRMRGPDVQCPSCGHRWAVDCPACSRPLHWRQHMVSDFLVGAHAEALAGSLLTRDHGFYRSYFPSVVLGP